VKIDFFQFNNVGVVPGHESVGIVKAVGEQVEQEGRIKVGMRVGFGYQFTSCGSCETCDAKFENLCDKSQPFAQAPIGGGYQTGVVWDSKFVFPIPDSLQSIHAAPLLCAGATVFTALYRFGDTPFRVKGKPMICAVLGLGGLGHLAIQFAKKMGYHVVALSSSANKEKECLSLGADEFHLHNQEGASEKLAGKFDIILNTISGDVDVEKFIKMLRPYGKICLLGLRKYSLQMVYNNIE